MTDENKDTDQQVGFTMEHLERILPDKHQRETLLHLIEHLDSDPAAMVVLKGHLVIEEKLTTAIERFVFHPDHLEHARLTFAQKLAISRSLSLDENKNSIWDLVAKLNTLRNTLSHSLEGNRRAKAMNLLRAAYIKECGGKLEDWESEDESLLLVSRPCHNVIASDPSHCCETVSKVAAGNRRTASGVGEVGAVAHTACR